MGRGRASSFARWRRVAQLFGLVLIAVAALVGPRLIEGYGALEWTRFHARQATSPHGADHARRAARAAARALDLTAPLPWAAEAAHLALQAGQALGPKNATSASAVYSEVRGALDRAASSPVRRFGLDDVAAQAKALDDDARNPAERTP